VRKPTFLELTEEFDEGNSLKYDLYSCKCVNAGWVNYYGRGWMAAPTLLLWLKTPWRLSCRTHKNLFRRIELLRQTTSGQALIKLFGRYMDSLRHQLIKEPREKEYKALMTNLWIDAHREAEMFEDSTEALEAFRTSVRSCIRHLQSRIEAEKELPCR
jgi:hypothetical protein